MATMTINKNQAFLLAVDDMFTDDKEGDPQPIYVLENDFLGVQPTTIISVDTSEFTFGTVNISLDNTYLIFQSAGVVEEGVETVTYTIKDSNGDESTATVTINIIP